MRIAVACLLLRASSGVAGQTVKGPAHSNATGHPLSYWIVSTSESRTPKEAIYMTTSSSRGEGALRGWTHENDLRSKFHIMPVKGAADTFYLVASSESRKPGHMAYLNDAGRPESWPWDPEVAEPKAQWRIVPSDPIVSTDGPAYFIVSTAASREPNEVLFFNMGTVDSWGFAERDDKCLWSFLLAPPSPPLRSAKERMEEHTQNQITGYITAGVLLCCCCACAACNNTKARRQRTRQRSRHIVRQVSSGHFQRAFMRPPIAEGRPVGPNADVGLAPVVQGVPLDVVDTHARSGNTNV